MPPSTSVARPRAAHLGPERRRPQILDAALEIGAEEGTAAITIGAISERLGVTRPVIYSCYRGRVPLVDDLLNREQARLLESVLAALHTARADDGPEAAFVAGFTALLTTVADHPSAWRLLLADQTDSAVSERFREVRRVVVEAATGWLAPSLGTWWSIDDLDRKMPVVVELFVSSCEASIRSFLDDDNPWSAAELAGLYGPAMCRALSGM